MSTQQRTLQRSEAPRRGYRSAACERSPDATETASIPGMAMGFSITSIHSAAVVRRLGDVNEARERTMEKLSSASRINRGGDDAAGLAVSDRMKARSNGLEQARRNIQDGISLLETAEGAMAVVQDSLRRMRTLAIQASSDTLTTSDREYIQYEIDQTIAEIDRQASTTTFGGRKLMGPVPNEALPADIVFVVDSSGSMAAEINNVRNGLNSLASGLAAMGVTARYSVVEMNDNRYDPPGYGANVNLDFTEDIGAVSASLGAIAVLGSPVQVYESIQGTLPGGSDAPSWDTNPSTLRFMIELTDTGIEAGETSNEAAQSLNLQAANVRYYGVVNPAFNALYDDLANDTGGQLYDVGAADYSGLLASIGADIAATAVGYHLEGPWVVHAGANADETIDLDLPVDTTAQALGVDDVDVTTIANAQASITDLDAALDLISGYRADIGAHERRLEEAMKSVGVDREMTESAKSGIRDTDFAASVTDLAREQMVAIAASSTLAQANVQSSIVLQLLR